MSLYVQPVTELVRLYGSGSYDNKDPYQATVTLLYEDSTTVTLVGLCGRFSPTNYDELLVYLRDKGIITVRAERRGVWKTDKLVNILKKRKLPCIAKLATHCSHQNQTTET